MINFEIAKIDVKNFDLTVKTQKYREFETEWSDEAIRTLIIQRMHHCEYKLLRAIHQEEAFLCNHSDSQIVIFVDKDGNEYGHFSEPTYNSMVEFLNYFVLNRGIIQQALRQYLSNIHNDDRDRYEIQSILEKYNKKEQDLENTLTELILVLES